MSFAKRKHSLKHIRKHKKNSGKRKTHRINRGQKRFQGAGHLGGGGDVPMTTMEPDKLFRLIQAGIYKNDKKQGIITLEGYLALIVYQYRSEGLHMGFPPNVADLLKETGKSCIDCTDFNDGSKIEDPKEDFHGLWADYSQPDVGNNAEDEVDKQKVIINKAIPYSPALLSNEQFKMVYGGNRVDRKLRGGGYVYLTDTTWNNIPDTHKVKFYNSSPPQGARGLLNKYPIGKNPDKMFASSEERYFMLYWDKENGLTLKYFLVYKEERYDDVLKGTLTNIENASQDENKKHRFRITGMKDGQKRELICIAFKFQWLKGRYGRFADDDKAQLWVNTINSELKKGPPAQPQQTQEPENRFGGVKSRLNIRRKNKTKSKKTQNKKKNRKNKNKQSKRQRR